MTFAWSFAHEVSFGAFQHKIVNLFKQNKVKHFSEKMFYSIKMFPLGFDTFIPSCQLLISFFFSKEFCIQETDKFLEVLEKLFLSCSYLEKNIGKKLRM